MKTLRTYAPSSGPPVALHASTDAPFELRQFCAPAAKVSEKSVIAAEAANRGVDPSIVEAEYVGGQSIARFVEPSEIADMCLFLASSASRMVSGQAISVDGHTETFHL